MTDIEHATISELPGYIKLILDFAEIVGTEMEYMAIKYPDKADVIDKSFTILEPPWLLLRAGFENTFAAYCKEQLQRIVSSQSTDPITDVEKLVLLSDASLKTPLGHDAYIAYCELAHKVFPKAAEEIMPKGGIPKESFDGATKEVAYPTKNYKRH
jgi:hypothetical protein